MYFDPFVRVYASAVVSWGFFKIGKTRYKIKILFVLLVIAIETNYHQNEKIMLVDTMINDN